MSSPSIYRVLIESAKSFANVAASTLVLAVMWIFLLQKFARGIVYSMFAFIPISCAAIGIYSLLELFHKHDRSVLGTAWLTAISVTSLAVAVISAIVFNLQRNTIKTSAMITKMASNVLCENPGVYFVSFLIIAMYLIYVAIWTGFFAHLTLLGHVESVAGPNLIKEWKLSTWSYVLQSFFIFMLVWTTCVFSNVQKASVAGVVSRWYFFHDSAEHEKFRFESFAVLKDTLNYTMGQVCFGSLIISGARLTSYGFWGLRKLLQQVSHRWTRIGVDTVGSVLSFLEKLVEHMTEFAIYHASISGEALCKSGRSVTRILRRNLALGLSIDYVAKIILHVSTLAIAAMSGMTSYVFASHVLKSNYGWLTGMLFSVLSWYILEFFSSIYSDTMDVALLCYALDLDMEQVHSTFIHQTFGSKTLNNFKPVN